MLLRLPYLLLCLLCALLLSCAPVDPFGCASMATRCGGADPANWQEWCESPCVPEHARTVPCDANADCLLCAAPRPDGLIAYFGLPSELEYLWTVMDRRPEPVHPSYPAPTGTAFHDGSTGFGLSGDRFGSWTPLEPYADVALGDAWGFCEPGPNQYLRDNVTSTGHELVLRAERMPEMFEGMYCPYPDCPWGPYSGCGPRLAECPYGDIPEAGGVGSASQVDRTDASGAMPTYGYGRYRGVLRASDGAGVGPQPGVVYAFFVQGNEYCIDGAPNLDTNTAEIDVELSAGPPVAYPAPFCNEEEMCFQLSTWVSSTEGIEYGARGLERHEVSGFRFRDRRASAEYRTYGWDWAEDEVRFTYDARPDDCDEHAGTCTPSTSSVAICSQVHYVPRRPSSMHAQLWNARWAGDAAPGTLSAMSLRDVWHEPAH